ncbi:MAG TPA: histidine kinase dimerization/phospho-acceptor domain-containing protein, partial [Vicinamibacterales bacterium]|nr:histidine kinase dimerization/phospho-acceptor domain-containing protein [Vicinamibacterales bacterium]
MTAPFVRHPTLRVRLTLWSAAALAVTLVLFAAAAYQLLRQGLFREIDRQLESDYKVADELMESAGRQGDLVPRHATNTLEAVGNWRWLEIWSMDGRLLYANPEDLTVDLPHLPIAPPPAVFGPSSVQLTAGMRARVLSRPFSFLGRTAIIRVIRSEEGLRYEEQHFLYGLLVFLPLGVVIAGLGGYTLARRALSPIAAMVERVRTITAERLGQRLAINHPDDELGQLAAVFNDMLARLEGSFAQLKRFTADVSHELRTPLTAIRSVGEVGLRERRTEAEYREIVGSVLEEADRLSHLVNGLLTIARGDSNLVRMNVRQFDASALVREVTECLLVLAEEKRQTITMEAAQPANVNADRVVLRHAVMNVIDNAIKYSPRQSPIHVEVTRGLDAVTIAVTDKGVGIAAEHIDKIFDRLD